MNRFKSTTRTRALLPAVALLSATAFAGEGIECPPEVSGWVASAGCTQYYLCEGGSRATPDYDCRDGFLFDSNTGSCEQESGVACESIQSSTSEEEDEEESSPPTDEKDQSSQLPQEESDSGQATSLEESKSEQEESSEVASSVYFMDVAHSTCFSIAEEEKPEWVAEIFPTKAECCQFNFAWMDIEQCTGVNHEDVDKPKVWTLAPTISPPPASAISWDTWTPTLDPATSTLLGAQLAPTAAPIKLTTADPEYFFMCGVDWSDASTRCHQRCYSGEDEECPSGEGCFSEANCPDGVVGEETALSSTVSATTNATLVGSTESSEEESTPHPVSTATNGTLVGSTEFTEEETTPSPTVSTTANGTLAGSTEVTEEISLVPSASPTSLPTRRSRKPSTKPSSSPSAGPSSSPVLSKESSPPSFAATDPLDSDHPRPRPMSFDIPMESIAPTLLPSISSSSQLNFHASGTAETLSPSGAPHTEPPNFVVKMIATPSTNNLYGTSEVQQESTLSEVYGYDQMVPQMDLYQTQESQASEPYLSLYNQVYGSGQTLSYEQEAHSPSTQHPLDPYTSITTPEVTTSELVLPVSADTTISSQRVDLNFGSNSKLALDGGFTSEQFDILLKFDISLVDHSSIIKSATLRIFSLEDCSSGGMFYSTTEFNSNWDTSSVTWTTAPRLVDLLNSIGGVSSGQWYEVDVTSAFPSAGVLQSFITIRVTSTEAGRCTFASLEDPRGDSATLTLEIKQKSLDLIVGMSGSFHDASTVHAEDMSHSFHDESPIEMENFQPNPIVSGEFALIRATADATVDAIRVDEQLGKLTSLHIAYDMNKREIFESLICFDLKELQQLVPSSAMLVLFPEIECKSAGIISVTEMNEIWSEVDMNWISAPNPALELGTFGAVRQGHWFGFNVLEALAWAHRSELTSITFRLSSAGEPCQFSSIESGRVPKLAVYF